MPAFSSPLNLGLDLFLLAVFTGVFLPTTRRIVSDLHLSVLAACGLGLVFFSYLIFLLGILSLLKSSIFIAILGVMTLIAAKPLRSVISTLLSQRNFPALDSTEQCLLALLLSSAVFNFLYGYAVPTGDDELTYHISLPLLYTKMGRFMDVRTLFHSYFYMNGEMIYTGLLLLRDVFAVKAMVWLSGLLFIVALYAFARRAMNLERKYALIAVALAYTAPVMTSLHGTTSVDLFNLFLEIVTVSLYWEWRKSPKRSYILIMGLLAGAAIGYRNYAVTWVAPLFCLMLFFDRRLPEALVFGFVAGCVFSPWPIRNFVLTGNPFYPSPSPFWAGSASDPYHLAMAAEVSPVTYFKTIWFVPFFIAGGTFIWDLGLIPFSLAPLAWLKKDTAITRLSFLTLMIFVLTLLIPWTWNGPRYFSAGLPWLALLASRGLFLLLPTLSKGKRKLILIWLGALLIFPNWALGAYFGLMRVPYFLGFQSEEAYLSRHYTCREGYDMMQYILKEISPQSKILLLGMAPCTPYYYYASHQLLPTSTYPLSFYQTTTEAFAKALYDDGISYVLFCDTEFEPMGDGKLRYTTLPRLKAWMPVLTQPLFEVQRRNDRSTLYKISPLASETK